MLRTALAADVGFTLPFAPAAPRTPAVARLLMERYGEHTGPRKPLDALQALLRRLRLARYAWDKISPSDRLDVAWVLWEGPNPPAEHEAFLRDFLNWVETPWRRLQATRLAVSWAAGFDPDLKSIRTVGGWLKRRKALLPEPWPHLAKGFDVFSVENGPTALADDFFAGEESAAEFFARVQLPARAAGGGLALEMLAAATVRVAPRLAREPRLAARLCALALHGTAFRPDATAAVAPQRGQAIRRALAETLLMAWQRQAPPPAVKAGISAFLLRHYGDVRVTRRHWLDVPATAVTILHRWLTEQSVAAYFHLAGQATSTDREPLAERREFWLSHLDRIDDAWLLCGSRGIAALGTDRPARGKLGGCRPDQSALLLQIGGVTILESSLGGSESVWLPGNPLAPALYRQTDPYWPASLARGVDFSSAHDRKSSGTWQQRLARFIERQGAGTAAA